MERRRIFDVLVAWYGIWQTIHLVLNIAQFAGYRSPMVTGSATGRALSILWVSGYADLVVVSPLGIAFAVGYFTDRTWSLPVGLISVSMAVYSAGAWFYLHAILGTWQPTAWRVAVMWGPFLPHLALWALLVRRLQTPTDS